MIRKSVYFYFSWVYETRSKQSGLTVLEIDIPSGYVIMNDTLRALVNNPASPANLKRAEFYKRKVVFYFEYVSKYEHLKKYNVRLTGANSMLMICF